MYAPPRYRPSLLRSTPALALIAATAALRACDRFAVPIGTAGRSGEEKQHSDPLRPDYDGTNRPGTVWARKPAPACSLVPRSRKQGNCGHSVATIYERKKNPPGKLWPRERFTSVLIR